MNQRGQIFKCRICGNIVEMLHAGVGELFCCGSPMKLFIENTFDSDQEKHLPVIKKTNIGVEIQVGSILHPMENDHFIEWIEILTTDNKSFKKILKPGDDPKVKFNTENISQIRAFCNLHGIWKININN